MASAKEIAIIATVIIVIVIAIVIFLLFKFGIITITTTTPSSSPTTTTTTTTTPSPSPTTTTPPPPPPPPPPTTTITTTTTSSSGTVQVLSFITPSDCNDAYCWGQVTFIPPVSGTLSKIAVNYQDGSSYPFYGSLNVSAGTPTTVWLDDFLPCNHLSCNLASQITGLTFVINDQVYSASVSPTTGDPLSPPPPISGYNTFIAVGPQICIPPPASGTAQVTNFIVANGCSDAYCWGQVTFIPPVSGLLTQVYLVYKNGGTYPFFGGLNVSAGTPTTVWLDDFLPCNHLSCNLASQITGLTFVINGQAYSASVSPTTGDPLSPPPPSDSYKFMGAGIC